MTLDPQKQPPGPLGGMAEGVRRAPTSTDPNNPRRHSTREPTIHAQRSGFELPTSARRVSAAHQPAVECPSGYRSASHRHKESSVPREIHTGRKTRSRCSPVDERADLAPPATPIELQPNGPRLSRRAAVANPIRLVVSGQSIPMPRRCPSGQHARPSWTRVQCGPDGEVALPDEKVVRARPEASVTGSDDHQRGAMPTRRDSDAHPTRQQRAPSRGVAVDRA